MHTNGFAEQLSFDDDKKPGKKEVPAPDWESEAMVDSLADKVENKFPMSDRERKFAIAKVIVEEKVPADLSRLLLQKIEGKLKDRKKKFYDSVGGKAEFERGARRNAFERRDHLIPEDDR